MSCTGSRPLHHLHNKVANTFPQIWLSNADCQRDHQCRVINMSHSPYSRTPTVNCTLTSLNRSFHALWHIQTLITPTNAQFHNLCIFQLLSSYMFRHCCHLQGAYIIISLKRTTINILQYLYICCDISSAEFDYNYYIYNIVNTAIIVCCYDRKMYKSPSQLVFVADIYAWSKLDSIPICCVGELSIAIYRAQFYLTRPSIRLD